MRFLSLLVLLLGPMTVMAQTDVVVTVPEGTSYLRFQNSGGSVIVTPIPHVNPQPTPVPPVPPPNPASTLREQTTTLAQSIGDPTTARNMAVGYSVVLLRAEQGQYSDLRDMESDVKKAIEGILDQSAKKALWLSARQQLSETLTRMAQEGKLSTLDEYKQAITDIRDGLMDSLKESNIGFDVGDVFQIVKLVLELLDGGEFNIQTIMEIVKLVITLFAEQGAMIQ